MSLIICNIPWLHKDIADNVNLTYQS